VALYLRFTHAISYRRLCRLFEHLYGLAISEGALDAIFRRAKLAFDDATAAILARLRRSRIVCSDQTSVRVDRVTCWNWVFQNEQVVIHVVRPSRGVSEVMGGHRPAIWAEKAWDPAQRSRVGRPPQGSDLFGTQQGGASQRFRSAEQVEVARGRHADRWQVCLAHQLRDCQFASEAGDAAFAPRMKALLLQAVLLARRRKTLAASTRQQYRRRLDRDLDAIMALSPSNRHGPNREVDGQPVPDAGGIRQVPRGCRSEIVAVAATRPAGRPSRDVSQRLQDGLLTVSAHGELRTSSGSGEKSGSRQSSGCPC